MARLERHGFALIACLLAGGGLVGCSNQVSSGPDVAAAPRAIELDAMGASYESGLAAQLDAALGPTPMTTFGFMVSHGADWISMTGQIAAADLGSDSLNLSVTSGALAPGFANVQVGRTAGAPDLAGAIVQLHFSPRAISGEVVPGNSDAPWSFDGDLSVSCSVPRAELPDSASAGGTSGPGVLIADTTFATPECAPLRRIAGQ